ncbi:MAG TPA: hypothetical protein VNZ06_06320 [Steroidobacteraceae bacterium]|jgi:hypothetical protein|nr:hypothetical protein [Steroidobacteraceae bacterium]
MKRLSREKLGLLGSWMVEEFSLFSLFPDEENLTDNFALTDAETVGYGLGKLGLYTLLKRGGYVVAAYTLEVSAEVALAPLTIEATLINADLSEQASHCGCH